MIQLIAPYLTTLKEIGFIVVMVLLGQLGQNRFNSKDEEDVKGLDLVIAVSILSLKDKYFMWPGANSLGKAVKQNILNISFMKSVIDNPFNSS